MGLDQTKQKGILGNRLITISVVQLKSTNLNIYYLKSSLLLKRNPHFPPELDLKPNLNPNLLKLPLEMPGFPEPAVTGCT